MWWLMYLSFFLSERCFELQLGYEIEGAEGASLLELAKHHLMYVVWRHVWQNGNILYYSSTSTYSAFLLSCISTHSALHLTRVL